MDKTRKSAEPEESVLRDAKEVIALEQYRHLADRPKPRKPPKDYKYLDELAHLEFELTSPDAACMPYPAYRTFKCHWAYKRIGSRRLFRKRC